MIGCPSWLQFSKKIPGIKKLHHFRFSSSQPGVVHTRMYSDQPEKEHNINKLDASFITSNFPQNIKPIGLSPERQWYLYDKIREFCPDDITCSLPEGPRPGSRAGTPNREAEDDVSPPPSKRSRRCGTCMGEGHNTRTCPLRPKP